MVAARTRKTYPSALGSDKPGDVSDNVGNLLVDSMRSCHFFPSQLSSSAILAIMSHENNMKILLSSADIGNTEH